MTTFLTTIGAIWLFTSIFFMLYCVGRDINQFLKKQAKKREKAQYALFKSPWGPITKPSEGLYQRQDNEIAMLKEKLRFSQEEVKQHAGRIYSFEAQIKKIDSLIESKIKDIEHKLCKSYVANIHEKEDAKMWFNKWQAVSQKLKIAKEDLLIANRNNYYERMCEVIEGNKMLKEIKGRDLIRNEDQKAIDRLGKLWSKQDTDIGKLDTRLRDIERVLPSILEVASYTGKSFHVKHGDKAAPEPHTKQNK